MVIVSIFAETGFFDYVALQVSLVVRDVDNSWELVKLPGRERDFFGCKSE